MLEINEIKSVRVFFCFCFFCDGIDYIQKVMLEIRLLCCMSNVYKIISEYIYDKHANLVLKFITVCF